MYSREELDQALATAMEKWDIHTETKKGIPEAIDALQTAAELKQEH